MYFLVKFETGCLYKSKNPGKPSLFEKKMESVCVSRLHSQQKSTSRVG